MILDRPCFPEHGIRLRRRKNEKQETPVDQPFPNAGNHGVKNDKARRKEISSSSRRFRQPARSTPHHPRTDCPDCCAGVERCEKRWVLVAFVCPKLLCSRGRTFLLVGWSPGAAGMASFRKVGEARRARVSRMWDVGRRVMASVGYVLGLDKSVVFVFCFSFSEIRPR